MKEEVLINLGFERNDVSEEESGDKAFYYFTMDFGDLCLISNANDESEKDGGYFVEVGNLAGLLTFVTDTPDAAMRFVPVGVTAGKLIV